LWVRNREESLRTSRDRWSEVASLGSINRDRRLLGFAGFTNKGTFFNVSSGGDSLGWMTSLVYVSRGRS